MQVAQRGGGWRPAVVLAALAVLSPRPAMAEAPYIPLEPGLVVTTAVHDVTEDYEVFRSVQAMDADKVTLSLHKVAPKPGGDIQTVTVIRVVRREDIQKANRLVAYFHTEDPEMFPGSTAMQASVDLLAKLKSGAETPFIFGMISDADLLGFRLGARKYFRGKLKRVEPEPVPVSVLVNGVRTELPAIHAKGTLSVGKDSGEGEFWWLDQPDNAIVLRWTFQSTVVQVVRIDTPEPAAVAAIAAALGSDACRAELHGVYFDTGSAALLAPSAAAVGEVAALLRDHADWRVTIEGHTDSVGGDDDNQRLSQARAAAVRTALVEDHGIAADRLTAAGFGETRPVESNDTVEGRAHNRRVELARQCP